MSSISYTQNSTHKNRILLSNKVLDQARSGGSEDKALLASLFATLVKLLILFSEFKKKKEKERKEGRKIIQQCFLCTKKFSPLWSAVYPHRNFLRLRACTWLTNSFTFVQTNYEATDKSLLLTFSFIIMPI